MDIFEQLTKEHQKIKELLAQLHKALPNELTSLIGQLEVTVTKHHETEEQILFPQAVQAVPMAQGGPRCTYFMGIRLEDDVTKKIMVFLKDNKSPIHMQTSSAFCDELVKSNHALSIPLGEHVAGHSLLNFIKSNPEAKLLEKALTLYEELMLLHIEKEDTCLFEMLKGKIPPQPSS